MREITEGMTAVSLAGHDKGQEYIIVKAEDRYLYLADGRLRTLERPKKKKQIHTQICYDIPDTIRKALEHRESLTDLMIKCALKEKQKKIIK